MRSPLDPPAGFGPGSQPEAEDGADLAYLPMPAGMQTFEARIPYGVSEEVRAEGMPRLRALHDLVQGWKPGRESVLSVGGLDAKGRALVDEILGEGEVSIIIEDDPLIEIQESIFAGIWRVRERDARRGLVADRIEIGFVPEAVKARSFAPSLSQNIPADLLARPGVVNAPALLTEITDKSKQTLSEAAHIINLTLLPHTPEDLVCLDEVLGEGPTRILSRGYGNCRINATRWPHVWRVRFYNSMDVLILDTIEIVDVPVVALAAAEDIRDSAERLGEVLEALA